MMLMGTAFASCSKHDDTPGVAKPEVSITVPGGGFSVDQLQWLRINPVVKNADKAQFYWTMGNDTLALTQNLAEVFPKAGTYTLVFTAANSAGSSKQEVVVNVGAKTYRNGVAKVFDYQPAPGQFVHEMPSWNSGDNEAAMIKRADSTLVHDGIIHLGGFGGYVVMGFDHTIRNVADSFSFTVKGNAFTNWSEPGIIQVSYDANGNGLPDDEWYEIAGSEHGKPGTIRNYQITYYKPNENKTPETSDKYPYFSDTSYIRWKDNQGNKGYLSRNVFHSQPYYPQWKGDSITFTGTRLSAENVKDQSGNGSYFVSTAVLFGYADNWANNDDKARIKISWAVDKNGQPVKLKGVDFIRVYTGVRAEGGWLGEISTEVAGVQDLNL